MNDINTLLMTVRDIMGRVKKVEDAGQMVKVIEVGPTSFVQLLVATPLVPGMLEPVTWRYDQFWVIKASEEVQGLLIGAYLNERLGYVKVIGIFDEVKND